MTDSDERLASIRSVQKLYDTDAAFLLRLLDTTRSERDAADDFASELVSAILEHCGHDDDLGEEYTVAGLRSCLDEHNQEFDCVGERAKKAESERDATLARVGEYLEAHAALGRLYDTTEECKAAIEREERAFNALRAALTPPEYPPEQPL